MNEGENTKIVRQLYVKFKAGDIAAVLDMLADKVEWHLPDIPAVPFTGSRFGREEVEEFFSHMGDLQEPLSFDPIEFIAQGTKVVVLGHYVWNVKSTGKTFQSDFAHVYTLQNGQITRLQEYTDTANAVAAYQAG